MCIVAEGPDDCRRIAAPNSQGELAWCVGFAPHPDRRRGWSASTEARAASCSAGPRPRVRRRSPPIQDRVGQLRRPFLVVSPRSGYRLNLVVPTVDGGGTFGGIRTALDLFEAIGADVTERRIVSVARQPPRGPVALPAYTPVDGGDDPDIPLQLVARQSTHGPARRPRRRRLRGHVLDDRRPRGPDPPLAGRHQRIGAAPFGYIIQDFEPGSIRGPRSGCWPLDLRRCRPGRSGSSTPRACATTSMRPGSGSRRSTRSSRGCCRRSGRRWPPGGRPLADDRRVRTTGHAAERLSGHHRRAASVAPATRSPSWQLVSVGQAHPDIDLGGGAVLGSIGKLDIPAYASLLASRPSASR